MDTGVAVAEEDDVVGKKEVVGIEFSGCSRSSSDTQPSLAPPHLGQREPDLRGVSPSLGRWSEA